MVWHVQALSTQMAALDGRIPREVRVAWYGVASEVRLMGDFDGWTRGVDLSADNISDSVFTHFEATLLLLPVCTRHYPKAMTPQCLACTTPVASAEVALFSTSLLAAISERICMCRLQLSSRDWDAPIASISL